MMITVSRLYPDGRIARAVVDELKAAGLPEDDIGIIAPSRDRSLRLANADLENSGDMIDRNRDGRDDRAQTIGRGTAAGAALGGAAGLLAGLGAFVLPGIGAVVAAGWLASGLASGLAGAVAGGAAGGIVGALVEAGVSEDDAAQFAEGVKRGGTLVTVRVAGQDREYYESIMAVTQVPKIAGSYEPAGMPVQLRDLGPLEVKRS